MILAFKQQFIEPIIHGNKIHTVREDPKKRWHKDRIIHFATGVRTKHYKEFNSGICTGVQKVFMTYAYNDLIEISIDGRELSWHHERLEFAQNDGFENWEDFFNWFYPIIKASKDECFSGKIIHWTGKRY